MIVLVGSVSLLTLPQTNAAVVLGTEWFSAPEPGVQIQDVPGFVGKLGVAGKDPTLVAPRFDRIASENAPHCAGTDRLSQRAAGLRSEVRGGEPTQGQPGVVDRLTR